MRSYPNIVITGTPGTGKSTHAADLVTSCSSTSTIAHYPLRHVDVGALVKEKGFHSSYDEEWESYEVDEDKLLDFLEPWSGGHAPEPLEDGAEGEKRVPEEDDSSEARGGLVLDWHTCDAWPERWIDLVVVLRCDHQILWNRLEKRGYPLAKIQENNTAEIMETVLEDARNSYPAEAVVELRSQEVGDVEGNVERLLAWIASWREARGYQ